MFYSEPADLLIKMCYSTTFLQTLTALHRTSSIMQLWATHPGPMLRGLVLLIRLCAENMATVSGAPSTSVQMHHVL